MRPVEWNDAELRVVRERLGLTVRWLAGYLAVDERTVRRWETGEIAVSAEAGLVMAQLEADTEAVVSDAIATAEAIEGGSAVIETYRDDEHYKRATGDMFPASWHRAMAARVAANLDGARVIYAR